MTRVTCGGPMQPASRWTIVHALATANVTSDFYSPHVVNELLREALAPYPDDLVLVTKVGAVRGDEASWNLAASADDLRRAVEDNLRNLGLERLDVVNFRAMLGGGNQGPIGGSIAAPFCGAGCDARGGTHPPSRRQQRDGAAGRGGEGDRSGRVRAKPV